MNGMSCVSSKQVLLVLSFSLPLVLQWRLAKIASSWRNQKQWSLMSMLTLIPMTSFFKSFTINKQLTADISRAWRFAQTQKDLQSRSKGWDKFYSSLTDVQDIEFPEDLSAESVTQFAVDMENLKLKVLITDRLKHSPSPKEKAAFFAYLRCLLYICTGFRAVLFMQGCRTVYSLWGWNTLEHQYTISIP